MGILDTFRKTPQKPKRAKAEIAGSGNENASGRTKIESARDKIIEEKKLSMLSKPNRRRAMIPDLHSPEKLKEMGLNERNGKWYVPNTNHFPDPLSEDSVIIDYTRPGGAPDIGFCSRDAFKKIYTDPVEYDRGAITYLKPEVLEKGKWIDTIQFKSMGFALVPEGTKVDTNEGKNVEVTPGIVLKMEEGKDSIFVSDITTLLRDFIADPMNPASKKCFELLEVFEEQRKKGRAEEVSALFGKLVTDFNSINRSTKAYEAYTGEKEITEEALRKDFEHAAQVVRGMDAKISSRIDSFSFDERIEEARDVLREIVQDQNLTPEQKNAEYTYVMARLLPKSNNHQHLKGSVPKETLLGLARHNGFDDAKIAEIEAAYARGAAGFDNLAAFNRDYGTIAGAIRTPHDYREAVKGIINEATRAGQLTVEIRCSVIGQRDEEGKPLDPGAAAQNIADAIESARTEIGAEAPKVGFTFLGYRGRDWKPEEVFNHAQLAVQFARENPTKKFSFDIAGPEDTGYPPKHFWDAFDLIKKYNTDIASGKIKGERIGVTVHAGETPTYDKQTESEEGKPGYNSIREAIEMGADRVGHGVQAVNDYATIALMKERGITVEICGVCNINSIPLNTRGMAIHPVERFLKEGVKISVCTDNDCICGTNVTQEYGRFLLTGHSELMNWNTVKEVARNGIESSFVSNSEKADALRIFQERIRKIEKLLNDEISGASVATAVKI